MMFVVDDEDDDNEDDDDEINNNNNGLISASLKLFEDFSDHLFDAQEDLIDGCVVHVSRSRDNRILSVDRNIIDRSLL